MGSAGELGYKGSRKSTPFVAGEVAETAAKIFRSLLKLLKFLLANRQDVSQLLGQLCCRFRYYSYTVDATIYST